MPECCKPFQSTLPLRGATFYRYSVALAPCDFNPRSPCGERQGNRFGGSGFGRFQSTLPLRGATQEVKRVERLDLISIHAPLAGSDMIRIAWLWRCGNFNPRSPCGERLAEYMHFCNRLLNFNPRSPCGERPNSLATSLSSRRFQSTLPLRGATRRRWRRCHRLRYFNPRSPCGERHRYDVVFVDYLQFQSTLPLRGATAAGDLPGQDPGISIHAPLAGSDLSALVDRLETELFQSTLPLRGATSRRRWMTPRRWIFQSTLPLRGATTSLPRRPTPQRFQSTLPLRGATGAVYMRTIAIIFQSTLPLRGATRYVCPL